MSDKRRRCWLFDVDGTLANNDHRKHHLEKDPKDWTAFFALCHLDPPYSHMTHLARLISGVGCVVFATGRSEADREKTSTWLHEHGLWGGDHVTKRLYMRPDGDHRADHIVKLEMLEQIKADGYEPIMVFEDRASVVKAWRSVGLPCAQVAEGDF